jgi:hypothetical protein
VPPAFLQIIMKKILIIVFLILAIFIVLMVRASAPAGKIHMTISQQNETTSSPLKLEIKIASQDIPFFGTAFHINFNPQQYKFQNYTLGNFFTAQDEPLILVKDNGDGIIMTGISLKQGKTITKPEGTLLTLNFTKLTSNIPPNQNQPSSISSLPHKNIPDFTFSHSTFATFNKQRQNIQNFTFDDPQKLP